MTNVLEYIYTREMPLLIIQLWGRRYKYKLFDIEIEKVIKYVFLYENGLASAYRNEPVLSRSRINAFLKKLKTDKDFLEIYIPKMKQLLEDTLKLSKEDSFDRKKLLYFLDSVFKLWELNYFAQFVPLEERLVSKEIRELGISLRGETDKKIHALFNIAEALVKRVYPQVGSYANYVSWDEVINDTIPSGEELKKRSESQTILVDDEIVSDEEFKNLRKKYDFKMPVQSTASNDLTIKGDIASKGVATGKVRIIKKEADCKFMQKGEILVSYMTMPAFLPAMKKAAAFVTDEGGVTCHAAIVARELNKPCIIGTKIATQVLSTGDEIVVDANKGVVRKVN